MKRFTLFFCVLCASMVALGQVKVQDGSLKIGEHAINSDRAFVYIDKTSITNYTQYGIYSCIKQKGAAPDGDCIGVYGRAYNPISGNYPARYVGVMGISSNASTSGKFNIGVAGLAGTNGNSVGLYGGISSLPASLSTSTIYAGYFSGQVYVTSQVSATAFVVSSDERLKQNIRSINNDVAGNLMQLNPVLYNLKQIEKQDTLLNTQGSDSVVVAKRYDEKSQEFQKKHYGFLAQELQKIYPDLVYEGGDGYLEINYIGMIPLLVSSIQELNEKIYTLEKALNSDAVRNNAPVEVLKQEMIDETAAALFQNTPNPFSENTEIAFYLPRSVANALLCIYDMNGKQLSQHTITERGNSVFVVSGSEYGAGMYLYSLIADNQLIDTKRMILTR